MPRVYRERRNTKTDQALAQMPTEQLTPYPVEWWQAEAQRLQGESCPRCDALTRSQYIAPKNALGECGIVQSCLLCGWERLVMHGRWGVPYSGAAAYGGGGLGYGTV